jgi:cold shock CspA family protein
MTEHVRKTGTVKTWRDDRGYGFIRTEDCRDLFFHHTQFVEEDPPRRGDHVKSTTHVPRWRQTDSKTSGAKGSTSAFTGAASVPSLHP